MSSEHSSQSAPIDLGLFGLIALGFATLIATAFFLISVSLGCDVNAQPRFYCAMGGAIPDPPNHLPGGLAIWLLALAIAYSVAKEIARHSKASPSPESSHAWTNQPSTMIRKVAGPFDPFVFALFFFGLLVVTLVGLVIIAASFSYDYFPTGFFLGLFDGPSGSFDQICDTMAANAPFGFVLAVEFLSAFVMERHVSNSLYLPARHHIHTA